MKRLQFLDRRPWSIASRSSPIEKLSINACSRAILMSVDWHYAEILLRDRTLTSYYDDVALKGLLLAANDAQRGVLTSDKILGIEADLEELVSQLADHEDVVSEEGPEQRGPTNEENLPLEWRAEAPVLCVAGRGPLDRAASIRSLNSSKGWHEDARHITSSGRTRKHKVTRRYRHRDDLFMLPGDQRQSVAFALSSPEIAQPLTGRSPRPGGVGLPTKHF